MCLSIRHEYEDFRPKNVDTFSWTSLGDSKMNAGNECACTLIFQMLNSQIKRHTCPYYCLIAVTFHVQLHGGLLSETPYSGVLRITERFHDGAIKWKHFPRYWPCVRWIHRSPVNFPRKGQWRRALMFSLICVWIDSWVNNREAGDLRLHRAHYDVIVMFCKCWSLISKYFATNMRPRLITYDQDLCIRGRYQGHLLLTHKASYGHIH